MTQLFRAKRAAEETARAEERDAAKIRAALAREEGERRKAVERLSYSYVLQARSAEAAGDDAAAALHFAEAHAQQPSDFTRACAELSLRRLGTLALQFRHRDTMQAAGSSR